MAVFLVVAMALLFIGNSVFTGTQEGLNRTFRDSLTGDMSLSAKSDDNFTLFGSELPLIGEFFKIPLIPRYDEVKKLLDEKFPHLQSQPVVIGAGKLSLGYFGEITPFFGVDLQNYFHFFPNLKLVSGTLPAPGQAGVLLNQKLYEKLKIGVAGRDAIPGEKLLMATMVDNSFVLRELPFFGVFAYPASDTLLDNVVLMDVGTARQLNAYYVNSSPNPGAGEGDEASGDTGDDVFNTAQDKKINQGKVVDPKDLYKKMAAETDTPTEDPGTWNFILFRDDSSSKDLTQFKLASAVQDGGIDVQVRDWRDTAGGNAKIVWFIQFFFNLGLIFISLVACLIVMNSLSLSVAERMKEIGTLRALGAQKSKVASLIGFETVILVTGAGVLGVLAGAGLLWTLAKVGGIPLTNPLIVSLFGTDRYVPTLSPLLMLEHCGLSLLLGLLSMGLPIKKALAIAPMQAMARE